MANFQSKSVEQELNHIKACWSQCLDKNIKLPLCELRLQCDGGKAYVSQLIPIIAPQEDEDRTCSSSLAKNVEGKNHADVNNECIQMGQLAQIMDMQHDQDEDAGISKKRGDSNEETEEE